MLVAYIGRPLRLLLQKRSKPTVTLFGHLLDGNLKAYFDYVKSNGSLPYEIYYVTIDERAYNKLNSEYNSGILLATRITNMQKIVDSKVIITSHGPMSFRLLHLLRPKIHFVDVWHGTAFKNYSQDAFKDMNFYQSYFVSSDAWKEIYHKFRGFDANRITVTGLAKHDIFLKARDIALKVRNELDLMEFKNVILYAPTWRKRGEVGEIPFGQTRDIFLKKLNILVKRLNTVIVLRVHINSSLRFDSDNFSNLIFLPQYVYPDTNRLLTTVDLLITDWSNIAADYCALDRPIIFLNIPRPTDYEKFGDTPLPMKRGGIHVRNMEELEKGVSENLDFGHNGIVEEQKRMKQIIFGNKLDGRACERYDIEIKSLLNKDSKW